MVMVISRRRGCGEEQRQGEGDAVTSGRVPRPVELWSLQPGPYKATLLGSLEQHGQES